MRVLTQAGVNVVEPHALALTHTIPLPHDLLISVRNVLLI